MDADGISFGSFALTNIVDSSDNEMNSSDDDLLESLDMGTMVEIIASDDQERVGLQKIICSLQETDDDEMPPPAMPSSSIRPALSEIIPKMNENNVPVDKQTKPFKQTTETERKEIASSAKSNRTKQNTIWGINIFQAWSVETTGEKVNLETIKSEDLNAKLSQFYCEARPKNIQKRNQTLPQQQAEVYHKNSLINIRAAINRRLTDLGRDMNLVRDKQFKSSNVTLNGLLKTRMRDGSSRATKHKAVINENDLKTVSTYLSDSSISAIKLRQSVWYSIALQFVIRGLEFHRQLRVNLFEFRADEHGETQQTNYQGGFSHSEAPEKRMYTTGSSSCPVALLKLLIQKTDPNAHMFFNQYLKSAKSDDEIWFTNKPLSSRTFCNIMPDICTAANLTTKYTAHCLRSTAIEALNANGFEARHILYMSDHKTESAIRSYNRSCTSEQRQSLSRTLSSVVSGSTRVESMVPATNTNENNKNDRSLAPVGEVRPMSSQTLMPATESIYPSSISNSASYFSSGLMTNNVFHECTFHFGRD